MGKPFAVVPSFFAAPSFAVVPSFVVGTSFAVGTFAEEASSVGHFASCVAAFSLPLFAGSGIH